MDKVLSSFGLEAGLFEFILGADRISFATIYLDIYHSTTYQNYFYLCLV